MRRHFKDALANRAKAIYSRVKKKYDHELPRPSFTSTLERSSDLFRSKKAFEEGHENDLKSNPSFGRLLSPSLRVTTLATTTTAAFAHSKDLKNEEGEEAKGMRKKLDRDDKKSMLTDLFNRHHDYLRISLTERCNLRCLYCMPAEGIDLAPKTDLLTADEIERIVRLFANAGVRKVRLTGGEPTVRKDLIDIVERIAKVSGIDEVAMTTNGVALKSKLEKLKENGLKSINLSLDSLVRAKFEFMTRRDALDKVLRSLEEAVRIGIESVKLNCVVVRGQNDDEILDFVNLAKKERINVRFIEYMPFNGNKWETKKMVSYAEMFDKIKEKYPSIERIPDPTPSEVGKNFRIDGFKGTVSFVTSMTNHFCGGCNRLRILADGNLKVCLFGNAEVSLRDAMRNDKATDEELRAIVESAVKRKKAKHAGMENLAGMENRSMIRIGG
jgi:GTP 3',8-cyclase